MCLCAIEVEGAVRLIERIVAAHLNGTVAAVGDDEGDRCAAAVDLYLAGQRHHLAGVNVACGDDALELRHRNRQEAPIEREAEVAVLEGDRVVHRHELRAVREGPFDLHLVDHLRHAVHHLRATEEATPDVHQIGDAPPVANQLEELRRDERDRLGVRQAQAAREALLREEARAVEDELVDLAGCEVHARHLAASRRNSHEQRTRSRLWRSVPRGFACGTQSDRGTPTAAHPE